MIETFVSKLNPKVVEVKEHALIFNFAPNSDGIDTFMLLLDPNFCDAQFSIMRLKQWLKSHLEYNNINVECDI